MERPNYLSKYLLDWEIIDSVLGGKSTLDSKFFIGPMYTEEQVNKFLVGYGLDPSDKITNAELFGNFQESVQFIKRYFLKDGNPNGLDLTMPNSIYLITDVRELFLLATESDEKKQEERLWAEIILKVMHTILHVDKDLRSNYFSVIQTQIFDRFYKYLHRTENQLYFGDDQTKISLIEFETKSKKTRDSVIIKLLHKAENVAEELFDRVGVRIVTDSRFDVVTLLRFLLEKNIIIPHNMKPSRSVNTMIDIDKFRERHKHVVKMAIKNDLSEDRFLSALNREALECPVAKDSPKRNKHMSPDYASIQLTCRQLIKYKNPFLKEFRELRKEAKLEKGQNKLANQILNMDISLISRDVRFFYPYELQIVDKEAHENNSHGEASHGEYKKSQVKAAGKRLFTHLLEHKKMQ